MAGPATAANITVNSLEQVLLGRDSFGLAVLLFVTFLDQLRPIVVLLPALPTSRLDSALCRQETETFSFHDPVRLALGALLPGCALGLEQSLQY